jgi:hypothetical protein
MQMMNHALEKYWYVIPSTLLSFICIFAIVKSLPQIKRFPQKKYFKIIFAFFLLTLFQLIIGLIDQLFIDNSNKISGRKSLTSISVLIYIICEYQIYVYLLLIFINSQTIKTYLKISRYFIFILAIILWFSIISIELLTSCYTIAEGILLLPACFYFFYEILTGPPVLKLNEEPSFWIVTGITFLFVCLIPAYIGIAIIQNFKPIGVMDYIGYCLLTILLLKGITCKTVQVA